MFDIKTSAAVWLGIFINGVEFIGILNFAWYYYTRGIKIIVNVLSILMFNFTQVFHAEECENCSLTEWREFKL